MRAVLKLELIADDYYWHTSRGLWDFPTKLRYLRRLGPNKEPSCVWRLLANGTRQRVQGIRDYSQANAAGSRGIYEYIPLTDGVYEINDRYHWNKVRHYYARVAGENITEITREEATAWLKNTILA